VPYGELDALRFKAELEVAQRELEDISKKAGIAELEWEDQRKQLRATIDSTALEPRPNPIWLLILITITLHFAARDAELNQLKMLVEQLADKVNARGDTPAERLAAVENRVDEVATHSIRLGTTLGLVAMATHTSVDYSTRLRDIQGGAPEDIDEIEVILERLDGHDDAIAELTHPQSVLNRLFD
jgi:DNA-binding ferritin-like protein